MYRYPFFEYAAIVFVAISLCIWNLHLLLTLKATVKFASWDPIVQVISPPLNALSVTRPYNLLTFSEQWRHLLSVVVSDPVFLVVTRLNLPQLYRKSRRSNWALVPRYQPERWWNVIWEIQFLSIFWKHWHIHLFHQIDSVEFKKIINKSAPRLRKKFVKFVV